VESFSHLQAPLWLVSTAESDLLIVVGILDRQDPFTVAHVPQHDVGALRARDHDAHEVAVDHG